MEQQPKNNLDQSIEEYKDVILNQPKLQKFVKNGDQDSEVCDKDKVKKENEAKHREELNSDVRKVCDEDQEKKMNEAKRRQEVNSDVSTWICLDSCGDFLNSWLYCNIMTNANHSSSSDCCNDCSCCDCFCDGGGCWDCCCDEGACCDCCNDCGDCGECCASSADCCEVCCCCFTLCGDS